MFSSTGPIAPQRSTYILTSDWHVFKFVSPPSTLIWLNWPIVTLPAQNHHNFKMHVYSILIGIIALPVYVVAVPTSVSKSSYICLYKPLHIWHCHRCRATKPVENISGYECYILSQIPVIIDQFGGVTGFSNLDVDHGRCKLPDSADVKASKDKNGSCYLGTDAGSQKSVNISPYISDIATGVRLTL